MTSELKGQWVVVVILHVPYEFSNLVGINITIDGAKAAAVFHSGQDSNIPLPIWNESEMIEGAPDKNLSSEEAADGSPYFTLEWEQVGD